MKRILIVRTDRIGDVVLSTPVIKALKKAYPLAFIAMMVAPRARDIVKGNPYLDEVLVFDKVRYGGFFGTLRFAATLKKRHFDTALVLHPTQRVHAILWLAGIQRRIGLDKKWGFLLTEKLPHTKQFGQRHEVDYNLDMLRSLGVETNDRELLVPINDEDKSRVMSILKRNGIGEDDDFVVIHPAASCASKRWPCERFAAVGDRIAGRFHKKIIIVAGATDRDFGGRTAEAMDEEALDLSGDLSIGELAALLERASLLVSNDSGPVHIAVALGIPVVAIFGRNQPGLSSKRWGPIGRHDIILHKDAGCVECLAHNCKIGFRCLLAIEPEEVVEAAEKLLLRRPALPAGRPPA
ncbi:MAG: glycosyltransferase family 9 protein [Candidatus Omnitrophica bacterium]|nr:glycosyltransferase family 9 protein [Candidatus Omnitrophota bacterium]